MKRLFFPLLLILFTANLFGAWLNDYDDGLEKAQKENKLVLMIYVKQG